MKTGFTMGSRHWYETYEYSVSAFNHIITIGLTVYGITTNAAAISILHGNGKYRNLLKKSLVSYIYKYGFYVKNTYL